MDKICPHCRQELKTDREESIGVCFNCRRYGLLHGKWPEPKEEKEQKDKEI